MSAKVHPLSSRLLMFCNRDFRILVLKKIPPAKVYKYQIDGKEHVSCIKVLGLITVALKDIIKGPLGTLTSWRK